MKYLTLPMIKKQIVMDEDFIEDDVYLESVGDSAEDMLEQLVNEPLDEIVANNGELPNTLKQALLIMVDYFYAVQRGSSANDGDMPDIVYTMIKLYRSYL